MLTFTISPIEAIEELKAIFPGHQDKKTTGLGAYKIKHECIKEERLIQECNKLLNDGIDTPLKLEDRAIKLAAEQKENIKFIEDKQRSNPDSVDEETSKMLIKIGETDIKMVVCKHLMQIKVEEKIMDIAYDIIKKF